VDGFEVNQEEIILSSTAMLDLIINFNEEGELVSINKAPKEKKF